MCLLGCQVKVTIGDKSLLWLNDVAEVLINSLVNSFFSDVFLSFFFSSPLSTTVLWLSEHHPQMQQQVSSVQNCECCCVLCLKILGEDP